MFLKAIYRLGIILLLICSSDARGGGSQERPPNILFIAVDDLRPEIHRLGASHMVTPHLDRLIEDGRAFTHHYVQAPTCGTSRYALLTGRVPSTPAEATNNMIFRDQPPREQDWQYESFAHALRGNGYVTAAVGKISHYPDGRIADKTRAGGSKRPELPKSWDILASIAGRWGRGWDAFFGYADGTSRQNRGAGKSPVYEKEEGDDRLYPDGIIAETALETLRTVSEDETPFLLAVGFFKPHLPFTAPAEYWSFYERDTLPLSASPHPRGEWPTTTTLHDSAEFNRYQGPYKARLDQPLPDDYARLVRHAYFASVSYVDAQIGKLLDEVQRLGLDDNTVVVVWGDHGWHLGDLGVWGKHTLHEYSLRSPLIWRMPEMAERGMPTSAVVETVDVYPTLLEIAGIAPSGDLSGNSLVPLLRDPNAQSDGIARSFYRDAVSVRSSRYRAIAHRDGTIELYDHEHDEGEVEDVYGLDPTYEGDEVAVAASLLNAVSE